MSLTPTEREEHFFKAMVDAADGSTPEELEPTERKEHWYKEIIDAIKSGGGSGGLPSVTASDAGKVLAVNDSGVWGAQNPRFVVTLTPTSLDYSGTMDKTVAEINEAYLSGQKIVFYISAVGMNVEFPLVDANKSDDYEYPSFDAVLWNVIDNVFMHVSTSFTDNGDKDTYSVYTFPMTYDSANGVSF